MLLAVLVPTACVLWFMKEAVHNQRSVARQKLAEAYRGQLVLVRDRLDAHWDKRAAELERQTGSPPGIFEKCVRSGLADSVICLKPDGAVAYPGAQAGMPTLLGQSAQAEIRALVQKGDKQAALRAIQQKFGGGNLARATDEAGRLIAADEQLLALHLLPQGDARWLPFARRLQAMLEDYGSGMPPAQRLFLMEEMRAFHFDFPTYAAERLAQQFLEADRARPGDPGLRLSGLPQIWKLTSTAGRVIALYRTETVLAAMRGLLDPQIAVTPPGAKPARFDEWTPAGARLPGWQITLAINNDKAFDEIARRQMAAYLWVGFLVIATMAVLALIAGQAFRREMRLARLKTDLVAAVSHELKTPVASIRLLVEALLDDSQLDPKKTREYLELMARENTRLSRLIDNFLTFSRMDRNVHKFEFAETRPDDVVHAAVDAVRERFPVSVQIDPGLPVLRADEDALVTALVNLLDNASKFTPEEKRIGLRAYSGAGPRPALARGRSGTCPTVCFAVEDNGIGISPREQKKIFRRFYQVDRRLSRHAGGCGLGLSIVEFIVKAHGGKVEVTSRPGAGSTFTVTL